MAKYVIEETAVMVFEVEARNDDEAMERWAEIDSNSAIDHETVSVVVRDPSGKVVQS